MYRKRLGPGRRLIPALVALGFVVSLLAACSGADSGSAPESSSGAKPGAVVIGKKPTGGGGDLVVASATEPENMQTNANVMLAAAEGIMPISRNILESLVARDKDGNLIPQLATSWTQTSPTVWTFELQQGVTFHDGSPFNAEAAATYFNTDYNAETANYVGPPATFKATDEYTLEMTTESPDPIVPQRMTMWGVWSAKQIEEDPKSRQTDPIGTGPYEFVSWDRGSQINLKLFPDYWRAPEGKMFDTVTWRFLPEASVRTQAIQTGEADVAMGMDTAGCQTIECTIAPGNAYCIARPDDYNQTFMGDERVRKAIAMAVDRGAINDAFFDGAPVLDNLVPKGSVGYADDVQGYEYNPDEAKRLLQEASDDGIDITQSIDVWARNQPGLLDVAGAFAGDLEKVGLTATARSMPDSEFADALAWIGGKTLKNDMPDNRNQIAVLCDSNDLFDAENVSNTWLTCEGIASVYCNPALDDQMDAARPLTGDERNTAWADIWKVAYGDVALLPLASPGARWAFSDKLQVEIRPDGILPLNEIAS
jgi:peptide/nickel transport system substrate-binding protein